MLPPHVFYAKIIDYQAKCNGVEDVPPEPGGVLDFVVAGRGEPLLGQLVGQSPRLG